RRRAAQDCQGQQPCPEQNRTGEEAGCTGEDIQPIWRRQKQEAEGHACRPSTERQDREHQDRLPRVLPSFRGLHRQTSKRPTPRSSTQGSREGAELLIRRGPSTEGFPPGTLTD